MYKCLGKFNNNIKTIEILYRKISELEKKISEHEMMLHINNECVICMSQPINHANIECGHMSVCSTCSLKIQNRCPLCRTVGKYIHIRWDGYNNRSLSC